PRRLRLPASAAPGAVPLAALAQPQGAGWLLLLEAPAAPAALAPALPAALEQVPVALAVVQGPDYRIEAANARMLLFWDSTLAQVQGRPHFEALPSLAGRGFEEIFAEVYRSGQPYTLHELSLTIRRQGQAHAGYFNVIYQPTADAAGRVSGLTVSAVEVTEQVRARQQVEQLNEELELRVTARSAETRAALFEAEQQREQLGVQQRLLSQILRQVPAAIATLTGPEHRFTFFNDLYQQLVGHRAVLGRTVQQVLPEVQEQGFVAVLDQVYATGQPFVGPETAVLLHQEGAPAPTQLYVDLIYQPLFDSQQRPHGILAFILDVTERVRSRKQAETLQAALLQGAQRQAQERQDLLDLFRQAPVAVVLLREPDHRIDYHNPAFEELFPPEEWAGPLRGHRLEEVYPLLRPAGLQLLLDQVFASGEGQIVSELPLALLQPGSPRFVTLVYQAYHEQGRIVGVAAFAYDVTDQVLARQAGEAARAELQRVFEQAPVAIVVYRGDDYTLEFVNSALAELMGQPAAALLGHRLVEFVPDAGPSGLLAALAAVRRTGQPFVAPEMPLTVVRAQGTEQAYFNFVYQLLPDAQGQPTGIICVVTEVTAQVRARTQVQALNDDLRATNQRLTRSNAELDTFVYTASHDLKAPISNIEGLLTVLRQLLPPTLDAEVPAVLALMDDAVQRFRRTLLDLTDVGRLQSDLLDEAATPVDLAALIDAVRLDIQPELAGAEASFDLDLAACPAVRAPARTLRSVLYNLLSNAAKYRDPARHLRVEVRCARTPGQFRLAVTDNGLGLTPVQQASLFQMYRRLHAHVPGSGVGLYMVKKLVENAGGSIAVESTEGVGSTFTVTLPTGT
ncbi:PAS domain-containing protein, partial [Hymenobacter sp. ASUV-10]